MALRDKLSKLQTEQLADLTEIMDEADQLESDLATANNVIAERDTRIAELQDQANRLYARILLSETGAQEEEEEKELTEEEKDNIIREKILGGN